MAVKVEIYQRDIVRPFSPTPDSLRNYKLSGFDQNSGTHYSPSIFCYSSGSHHHHDYDRLKESLSKTLSILYPLAGRVAKDGFTIECNDKGVEFVQANVRNYDLADFLRPPKLDSLKHLLPHDPFPMEFHYSQPMLGVQVNRFGCGGTAVGICLWHGVADGAAIAGFLQTWAAINRGDGLTTDIPNINIPNSGEGDLIKLFPPQANFDFSASTFSFVANRNKNLPNYSTKRFVFPKQEIERMRDEHNLSNHNRRPSRVAALTAFIWAAVTRATLQANPDTKTIVLLQMVDLRKRMNLPYPSMCLGNILFLCTTWWEANCRNATPQSLIGRIQGVTKVSDKYVRKIAKLQASDLGNKLSNNNNNNNNNNGIKAFGNVSTSGFPFRKCDFGWGKPIWFVPGIIAPKDGLYMFDSCDDGGLEVWIGLTHQIMSNLDKDKEFLAHVSCSQIIPQLYHLPSNL